MKNKYLLHKPTPKQTEFLRFLGEECLYGGAAGGGKSDALLMAALQFVDQPGYSAIIFRKTFQDLTLPEALIDRAFSWLSGSDARWNAISHSWTFPTGAKLCFGYLDTEQDKYRYQSSAFQFEGFDELTQFPEQTYRYMFSRLRRLESSPVPLRMRAASNPGNIGHDWVKQRFIEEGQKYGRPFIKAKLQDNPHLDAETYIRSLSHLDPITRRQYLNGDWSAKFGGSKFKREWFVILDNAPADPEARVRYWDMAATTDKTGKDPDYTAGAKVCVKEGIFYIEDILRFRKRPAEVEKIIAQTAQLDEIEHGRNKCVVYMEIEPGSEGLSLVDHYSRNVLYPYDFRGNKATGNKELRSNPVSSAAEQSRVRLIQGTWINAFLDEAEAFPLGMHDDQVDAVSGAFDMLKTAGPIIAFTGEVPR